MVKKLRFTLLAIVLYFVLEYGFSIFNYVAGIESEALVIIEYIIMIIVLVFYERNNINGDYVKYKENLGANTKKWFKYWCVGFTVMLVSNLIISTILGGIAPNEEANRALLETYSRSAILATIIFAPIIEELTFRASFKDLIKGRKKFIIITGLIFASLHVFLSFTGVTDLLYLIPYSALGITFSAIYYDTDSICSSILAHMFHNTICLAVIFLGV